MLRTVEHTHPGVEAASKKKCLSFPAAQVYCCSKAQQRGDHEHQPEDDIAVVPGNRVIVSIQPVCLSCPVRAVFSVRYNLADGICRRSRISSSDDSSSSGSFIESAY